MKEELYGFYDHPLLLSLLSYFPEGMRDPETVIPIIVSFYVVFLAVVVSGVLHWQGKQIKKAKDQGKVEQFHIDLDDEKDWREFQASIAAKDIKEEKDIE